MPFPLLYLPSSPPSRPRSNATFFLESFLDTPPPSKVITSPSDFSKRLFMTLLWVKLLPFVSPPYKLLWDSEPASSLYSLVSTTSKDACQTIKLDKFYVPPGLRSPCFFPICAFYNSNDATIMKLRFTRAQSFYDRSNSREEINSYTNTKDSSLLILSYTHPSYLKFEIFFSPAVSNSQLMRINHYLHATPTLDCCNYHTAL